MNADQCRDEMRLRLLKIISEAEHDITQREMAKQTGISLGKTNYWITEMVKDGFIQIDQIKSAINKSSYKYNLTPRGMEERYRLLIHFLSRKLREYEILNKEIEELNRQILEYQIKKCPEILKN